jgi:hypothetical protein
MIFVYFCHDYAHCDDIILVATICQDLVRLVMSCSQAIWRKAHIVLHVTHL